MGGSWPPTVRSQLDESVRDHWLKRAAQHTSDTYAGVPMSKFPEDLRTYEHLIWESRPDVIIEIGVHYGGGTLWLRDRLACLARYTRARAGRVIGIDHALEPAVERLREADPEFDTDITLVEADIRDPGLPDRVRRLLHPGERCLVIEDSAHVYETTAAALSGFAQFVAPGDFFVVEDGCVDIEPMRLDPGWPRGVLAALEDWLLTPAGAQFETRRDLELYGISCHPRGFLQRRATSD